MKGSLSLNDRKKALTSFIEDPKTKIMLISLMAGSVGLNLVAANNVILVDPWWNPAIEEQAVERLHRIGQKKDVNIYKMITINSVEERMLEVQERKKDLRGKLFSGEKEDLKRQNLEDFKNIFKTD